MTAAKEWELTKPARRADVLRTLRVVARDEEDEVRGFDSIAAKYPENRGGIVRLAALHRAKAAAYRAAIAVLEESAKGDGHE